MRSGEFTRAWAYAALLAITALALVVRLWGLDFLLPHFTHLDGTILFDQVALMRANDPNASSHAMWPFYPHLVSRLVSLLPDTNAVPLAANASLAEHLARATAPILQIRYVSALATVLLVPGTYWLARIFMSRGWALCAAGWVATSSIVTSFGQQDRPHGVASALSLFAVLAAVRLRRNPRFHNYVVAGLAVGLAIGALHYGAATLAPLLIAFLLRERSRDRVSRWSALATTASVLLALALICACIRYFYPFHFQGTEGLMQVHDLDGEPTFNISSQSLYLSYFDGTGFGHVLSYLTSFDPLLSAAALFAVLVWLATLTRRSGSAPRANRRDAWVVLAFAVPYFLLIGAYSETAERFIMPLVPYIACLGAWGLASTLGAWASARTRFVAATLTPLAIVAVLQVPAAAAVLRMDYVRASPDTFEQAADWIAAHARPNEDVIIAMPYLELPLFHRDEELAREPLYSYWEEYEAALPDTFERQPRFDLRLPGVAKDVQREYGDAPLAHVRELGGDFVVIQHVGPRYRYDLVHRLRAELRALGEPSARFSPFVHDDGDSANNSIRYQQSPLVEPFFWRMFRSRAMGTTIEIYRVGDAPAK